MIPAYPTLTASTHLIHDMARTTLTLDAVYSIYAAIGVGVIGLWAIGVLAFGKVDPTDGAVPTPRAERATPVVP